MYIRIRTRKHQATNQQEENDRLKNCCFIFFLNFSSIFILKYILCIHNTTTTTTTMMLKSLLVIFCHYYFWLNFVPSFVAVFFILCFFCSSSYPPIYINITAKYQRANPMNIHSISNFTLHSIYLRVFIISKELNQLYTSQIPVTIVYFSFLILIRICCRNTKVTWENNSGEFA